jgi:DNA-directed RNA polymerase
VVLQAYPKLIIKRIKLTFNGGVHYQNATVGVSTELDRNRQTNGISPNWVHSMDASHMRATVRACWREGMRSFCLIHDSYGTHAGNAAVLAEVLREQFVEMYSQDVLQSFKEELEMQLPEGKKLPPLPPKGALDLELVKQSKYFFA